MINDISFPKLFDHVFHINRVAFTVFGRPIMWYGIILAICFLLAAAYTLKRVNKFNWNVDQMTDMILWGIPAGILGCRVYYVINEWDYYSANPGEIIKIWNGGLAIYGGIIGGVLAAFITARVLKKKFREAMQNRELLLNKRLPLCQAVSLQQIRRQQDSLLDGSREEEAMEKPFRPSAV